ncbi:hypothetical protein ACP4OV_007503 [Aristida adscensionis]
MQPQEQCGESMQQRGAGEDVRGGSDGCILAEHMQPHERRVEKTACGCSACTRN